MKSECPFVPNIVRIIQAKWITHQTVQQSKMDTVAMDGHVTVTNMIKYKKVTA